MKDTRKSFYGPKILTEYFQRYRVIYGHYQVKKLTGQFSQHPLHLLPFLPLTVIRISLWLFKTQNILILMAFTVLN